MLRAHLLGKSLPARTYIVAKNNRRFFSSLVKVDLEAYSAGSNGKIGVVTLNRSAKLNALNYEMFISVANAAREVKEKCDEADSNIKAIVLNAAGRSFCAGLDVKSISRDFNAMRKLLDRPNKELVNKAQAVSYLWRKVPVPVICCIQGVCLGGGLQIALGADYRIADINSKMSILEAKWGIIPDMCISILLRELLPLDKAKQLTMTAEILRASKAKSYGLINQIEDSTNGDSDRLLKAGVGFAREILAQEPDARRCKKQLNAEKAKRYQMQSGWPMYTQTTDSGLRSILSSQVGQFNPPYVSEIDKYGLALVRVLDENLPYDVESLESFESKVKSLLNKRKPCFGIIVRFASSKYLAPQLADRLFRIFKELPIPVVACLEAEFSGNEILWTALSGADFRIAHNDCCLEMDFTLLKCDSQLMAISELVRLEHRENLSKVCDVHEAKRLGLVTEVSNNPYASARKLAKTIAKGSPSAASAVKLLYNKTWHTDESEALREETRLQEHLLYKYNWLAAVLKNFLPPMLHLPYKKVDYAKFMKL